MPRYYCDYCDTYLTHDSPSVRKQHNAGYKHKANVRCYYQQYEAQLNQSMVDQKVKEHLGACRPPVAPYNHLRPGFPVLSMPLPVPGQFPPGVIRHPILPRPMPGVPGYPTGSPMPQMVPPQGAPPLTGQMNGLQQPSAVPLPPPPPLVPGGGGPQMYAPPMYQPSGGSDGSNNNAQAPEAN